MASATVCVRLRVPSFAFAFLKWLRTVSSPTPSVFAVSCNVRPIEACRNTACSLGVRTACEPTRFTSSPTSLSKRTAAALAAILSKPRACWVKLLPRTPGDQNATTHRPPTGHRYPSRMPYFSRQFEGPSVDPDWIKHSRKFRPCEGGKARPCGHQSYGVAACYKRGPLLQPSPRNIRMHEDILAKFNAAPVTNLDGKAVGTMDTHGIFL